MVPVVEGLVMWFVLILERGGNKEVVFSVRIIGNHLSVSRQFRPRYHVVLSSCLGSIRTACVLEVCFALGDAGDHKIYTMRVWLQRVSWWW